MLSLVSVELLRSDLAWRAPGARGVEALSLSADHLEDDDSYLLEAVILGLLMLLL
jgi:hypothetical protein